MKELFYDFSVRNVYKISIMHIILSLTLLLAASTVCAQDGDFMLGDFKAASLERHVLLRWGIKEGQTCNGIKIWRGTDTLNMTKIGEIYGVCGSFSEPVAYDFTDTQPIENKVSYYKLELGKRVFSSSVIHTFYNLINGKFVLKPNPVINNSELIFSNASAQPHTLEVYGISGKKLYETNTIENYFNIDKNNTPLGIYFFIIKNNEEIKVKGKFFVK